MNALPDCPRFAIGDMVWHKCGEEARGVVTGITFYPGGFYYRVCFGPNNDAQCYECELTGEPSYDPA